MTIEIESLDHLVLTVQDVAATVAWYERVLGMKSVTFGDGRQILYSNSGLPLSRFYGGMSRT